MQKYDWLQFYVHLKNRKINRLSSLPPVLVYLGNGRVLSSREIYIFLNQNHYINFNQYIFWNYWLMVFMRTFAKIEKCSTSVTFGSLCQPLFVYSICSCAYIMCTFSLSDKMLCCAWNIFSILYCQSQPSQMLASSVILRNLKVSQTQSSVIAP